jgi:hypothetical protein
MSKKQELWLPGMQEDIYVPENISDLLEVEVDSNCTDSEFEGMILVNNSSQQFLDNELDLDTYLDILDSVGIDPYFHLQEAAWVVANLLNY